MGIASRRGAEDLIRNGRVSLNGVTISSMGVKVIPGTDEIRIDGKHVREVEPPKVYWMLHKPDMCLSSHQSQGNKQTIFDLPALADIPFKVNCVGRLDYRTEGLLLLSNDGDFIHHLTHPSNKVPRVYYVLSNKKLSKDQLNLMRSGIPFADGKTLPCQILSIHGSKMGKTTGTWYQVTVYEGRNRLVRRLFEHFEAKVVKLFRHSIGDLRLDESLKPGSYRQLTSNEIRSLRNYSS